MLPAVWVNGQRQPAAGLHVSARDRGLTLSDGVFETMRVHAGRVFRLDQHLARLERSLAQLQIPSSPELRQWIDAAMSDVDGGDAAVRLTVTRGVGAPGLAPPADAIPTVLLVVSARPVVAPATYERGLAAHIASGRRNEYAMTAGLKTVAYTDAVAALLEARQAGADEAIFLDTAGHCSEATASNLFVVSQGILITPPLTCAALPGITRSAVLELADTLEVGAEERAFGLDDLLGADEVFLTSSLRGIAPVSRIDGRAIGDGSPGPLTRRIAAEYATVIERECG